jgi:hypothetical protein
MESYFLFYRVDIVLQFLTKYFIFDDYYLCWNQFSAIELVEIYYTVGTRFPLDFPLKIEIG